MSAIPQGWMLVPVEPTTEMIRDGAGWGSVETTWRNMLAAAPQPAKREPLTDEQISELFAEKVQSEMDEWDVAFARAIERAHGIGGES